MKISTDELIDALESDKYQERWFAAEILGTKRKINRSQAKKIVRLMETSDVGEVLCWGLGQMGSPCYVYEIAKLLNHPDTYYKWRAADALKGIGSDDAIKLLESYLKKSESCETRWRCAWALGEIGSMRSFDSLWESSQEGDKYVRWKSIWAISSLKGDVEGKIREKILDETTNEYMLWRCLWVLGRVGDVKTREWLNNLNKIKKHSSKYIRYQLRLTFNAIDKE